MRGYAVGVIRGCVVTVAADTREKAVAFLALMTRLTEAQ